MTFTTQKMPQSGAAMNEPGYEKLACVLHRAYAQASAGKGKERHANGRDFHLQPMQDLIRLHGVGFATGQASKKASEALGLPTVERQVAELLGAIVYLSGAVIALERDASGYEDTLPTLISTADGVVCCGSPNTCDAPCFHGGQRVRDGS